VWPVKEEIDSLNEKTAPDVDGWITQAKKLHADIEWLKITAREIITEHEKTRLLHLDVADTSGKVELLKTEIAFNETLVEILEGVHALSQRLNVGQNAIEGGSITEAIESLEEVERTVERPEFRQYSSLKRVTLESAYVLRSSIIDDLRSSWSSAIRINRSESHLQVSTSEGESILSRDFLHTNLSRIHVFGSNNRVSFTF
jgi:protein transport protein DSL1/ZW10